MKQLKRLILNQKKYGKGLGLLWKLGWGWVFYGENNPKRKQHSPVDEIDKEEENTNLVTVSDSFFPTLTAVTEKQFKSWNKQKITYKFRWSK